GVGAVAFSPDGKTLASGAWQDHTIRIWDLATRTQQRKITLPTPNGWNYGDIPLVFTPDGKILISGSADRANNVIYFWDTATGKELRQIKQQASGLALSPDGKLLASSGWQGKVCLWDVATGNEHCQFPAKGSTLAFSPDGRVLAYG